ncbi:MAG: DUF2851 family protein [Ignavibacteriales bacterium]|nr:MAG: DUF2851 family protein [Ignavibacteriales bacterium]
MEKKIKVLEKFLHEIWKEQNFHSSLVSHDGEQIKILDAGTENIELGGPDFRNARIQIGNITYTGDVEIDSFHSDWKKHGHFLNKRYNKVILHAALLNDSNHNFVYTQDGRKVESVAFESLLKNDLKSHLHNAITAERKNRINKMPCVELNNLVTEKDKIDFLFNLGIERFKIKKERMLQRLKEIIYLNELKLKEPVVRYSLGEDFYNRNFTQKDFGDQAVWHQLIYESIFEALGYSKNKEIMHKLAKAVEIEFILKNIPVKDFNIEVESLLLHAGGLLPAKLNDADDDTIDYLRSVQEAWNNLKEKYDGVRFSEEQWHFFKLRPQNFPTIRLAGGVRLLHRLLKENLVIKILNQFKNINNPNKLTRELRNLMVVNADGYWKQHYIFNKKIDYDIKYFVGVSRADEIIINVILPVIAMYFDMFGKKELSHRVMKLYLNYYQNSENNLVNEVSSTLHLNDAWKRSVLYQGLIELFRSYCSREKCLECRIGEKIFN